MLNSLVSNLGKAEEMLREADGLRREIATLETDVVWMEGQIATGKVQGSIATAEVQRQRAKLDGLKRELSEIPTPAR